MRARGGAGGVMCRGWTSRGRRRGGVGRFRFGARAVDQVVGGRFRRLRLGVGVGVRGVDLGEGGSVLRRARLVRRSLVMVLLVL